MNYHIKEIYLNETFDRYSIKGDSSNPSKIIPNLSKINIFVGANNSGKSRFLRQLASTEKVSFAPAANKLQQDSSSIDYNDLKEELLKNIKTLFESVGLEEANSILFGIQKNSTFRSN
jgi:AAA15 family ATPase/GTPase